MDAISWMLLFAGILFMLGAWTNALNFNGDETDEDRVPWGYTGALIFEFIFMKNRAAYRAFVFFVGIGFVIAAFYFAPAVRAYFQSSTVN